MVIGAGDTSEKTARALLSRGAKSLVVANRSLERAEALAKELGGRAVQFDDWAREFEKIDIAISSTASPTSHPDPGQTRTVDEGSQKPSPCSSSILPCRATSIPR